MAAPAVRLVGVDFTSAPTRRKPVTVALGRLQGDAVRLDRLEAYPRLDDFGRWLAEPGPWVGAFDFPFGLPRELVRGLGWPEAWPALIAHYAQLSRGEIRSAFAAWCDARPAGAKFAHRAFDRAAGASPSMKWVNPPVAYMLHAGVPLLLRAGVHLPGLCAGDPARVALEGYPGLLARELLGGRSYKSDDRRKHTPERLAARRDLVAALEQGRSRLALRLRLQAPQREALLADASADRLDAVLCLLQAGWAAQRPRFGLPAETDPIEGWIVTLSRAAMVPETP